MPKKTKLSDLKEHLFAQLERLNDEDVVGEALDAEVKRAVAITGVADQLVKVAALQIRAAEIASEYSTPDRFLREFESSNEPPAIEIAH